MHIVHVSPWRLPASAYGGSQRVLWWLARAQLGCGDEVTLFAPEGTWVPGARLLAVPDGVAGDEQKMVPWVLAHLPREVDVIHWQRMPPEMPQAPFVVTVHGNSAAELQPHPNKVYLSRNHAQRAGAAAFVYNGLDPSEYNFREKKDSYVLFLGKLSRRSKGIRWALEIARKSGVELVVAGGTRWGLRKTGGWWASLSRRVHFIGEVAGWRKAELLAGARALLFPIQWEEPFGLVMIEALVSGTPVLACPRGAAPEILTPEVGALCRTVDEFCAALAQLHHFSPTECRQRVLSHFTAEHMAAGYRARYLRAMQAADVHACPSPQS